MCDPFNNTTDGECIKKDKTTKKKRIVRLEKKAKRNYRKKEAESLKGNLSTHFNVNKAMFVSEIKRLRKEREAPGTRGDLADVTPINSYVQKMEEIF